MEFKKIYLTVSVIALTCSQYAVASPLDNTSHTHTQHTLELKPISNSFQLAASTFLPDYEDGLDFSGKKFDDNHGTTPKIDLCSKFPLSSCPANAKCSKCTSGNKFKLNGCNEGFKLSAGTCVALTCPEINSAYRADVPVNQVCSTISTYGKTCYQTCKTIDFAGYPITSCPANATCADHPDCATTSTKKGNCSPVKKKVTTCTLPSQKLNANASGCINKDDTCPTTYFKTCETGTTGTARYTELGTACYQCKPITPPTKIGDILYGDGTISPKLIAGKTPIAIVFDPMNSLAVSLLELCVKWSDFSEDMPNIENCLYTDYDAGTGTACFVGGKENTQSIIKNMANPGDVIKLTFKFQPNGCSNDFCKTQKWFVPSIGEVRSLCSARTAVISGLELVRNFGAKTTFPGQGTWYWSSTEGDGGEGMWTMQMDYCYSNMNYRKSNARGCFRPVINFGSILN